MNCNIMGKSSSKFHNEIAAAIYKDDLTSFATILNHLESINSPLYISPKSCNSIDIQEDWNPSAVHLICYLNKPSFLSFITQGYPELDLNLQDSFGNTPLMIAVKHRKEKIIEALLSKGAGVLIRNQLDCGDTALHYACEGGDMRIALLIISNSTDIDVVNQEGMTPLMYAIQKKHVKLAETLVSMGADPFITDKNQCSALDWAEKTGLSYAEIERLGRHCTNLDQNKMFSRSESNAENNITITDRSFIRETESPQRPGFFAKTLWKGIDFLVTDQISWVRKSQTKVRKF